MSRISQPTPAHHPRRGETQRLRRSLAVGVLALSATAFPLEAQVALRSSASDPRPWLALQEPTPSAGWGAELGVPFFSLLLPGLGQYTQGAGWVGAGYSATAVAGYAVAGGSDPDDLRLPRDPADQLDAAGLYVAGSAGLLSGWDAFQRALPRLHAEGKYDFLEERQSLGSLLTAPFDPDFLGRWTTWVNLGFTAAITGIVLSDRDAGANHLPFRGHDAAFVTHLSYNAAVSEEAMFRGWLMPVFHQKMGRSFWAANGLQGVLFGALHTPNAREFAAVIGAWAVYTGWVTRRNGWDIRESIFNHFWYDVFVATAELLTEREGPVPLPSIRIPIG